MKNKMKKTKKNEGTDRSKIQMKLQKDRLSIDAVSYQFVHRQTNKNRKKTDVIIEKHWRVPSNLNRFARPKKHFWRSWERQDILMIILLCHFYSKSILRQNWKSVYLCKDEVYHGKCFLLKITKICFLRMVGQLICKKTQFLYLSIFFFFIFSISSINLCIKTQIK
jgi:hypothetical protein